MSMLEGGFCDANATDADGDPALLAAVEVGHVKIVVLLLRFGALAGAVPERFPPVVGEHSFEMKNNVCWILISNESSFLDEQQRSLHTVIQRSIVLCSGIR